MAMVENRDNVIFDDLYIPETVELTEHEKAEVENFLRENNISITD